MDENPKLSLTFRVDSGVIEHNNRTFKAKKMINELNRKLNAKFIPFEVFSDEKLQFIASELSRLDIPFVEENNALYIPDYAQKRLRQYPRIFVRIVLKIYARKSSWILTGLYIAPLILMTF